MSGHFIACISGRGGEGRAGREAGLAAEVGLQLRPLRRLPRREGVVRHGGRDRHRRKGRLDFQRSRPEVDEELRSLQGGRRGRKGEGVVVTPSEEFLALYLNMQNADSCHAINQVLVLYVHSNSESVWKSCVHSAFVASRNLFQNFQRHLVVPCLI